MPIVHDDRQDFVGRSSSRPEKFEANSDSIAFANVHFLLRARTHLALARGRENGLPHGLHITHLFLLAIGILFFSFGCAATPDGPLQTDDRKHLELLMPNRIDIVEPFTRARSFDADSVPDGIELLVQAVNALDDPGLMIVGAIRIDLFEHVPASGHNEGRRLEHWDIELSDLAGQKKYWNKVTQMYEFKLGVDPQRIPPADKYVLVVNYRSPLGEQFRDECLVSYRLPAGPLGVVSQNAASKP